MLHWLILQETRLFSAYFFARALYIIFWPWGLLTFYGLGECKAEIYSLMNKKRSPLAEVIS